MRRTGSFLAAKAAGGYGRSSQVRGVGLAMIGIDRHGPPFRGEKAPPKVPQKLTLR